MSEQILNQILEQMGGLKDEMSGLKDEINGLKGETKEIKQEMNERFTNIESTMATKEDIKRIENIIKEARIENINSDSLILQKQDEMQDTVKSIEDTAKNIQTTQDKHEKIVERLSLRSIEQEQDIAELRRIK
ncbi:MAG TPA: hypothetical protein GX497_06410 [Bacillus bacterium]|nr:hypothetical protein [Bacillus sp. (in: firmicutes)]